ncbi:MAG TPA: CPBP family intramembrane glutamic endopeptidase [Thermoanaerobaculia bacterium]|nr:CPBP family intramembrane glutamic endopeptidase [Thermoanaerobaculia bacterium]
MSAAAPGRRAVARRSLALFFVLVVGVSAWLEWSIAKTGRPVGESGGLIFLLMWTPAAASLVCRLAFREGIRDVSFRFGGRTPARPLLLAWLLPLAVGVPAYGVAWATGLARFDPPDLAKIAITGLRPIGRFAVLLLLTLTVVTLISALSAAGEEIGWRGFMLTRLVEAGVPAPLLVSGVVWALWHVPLILTGQYAAGGNRTLSAILFVTGISAAGCAIGFLRLSSGSVWPAVLLHASWNAVIQGAFDASSKGGRVWIGESGLLVVAGLIALSAWLARGAWAARRAPGEPPFATLDALGRPAA